MLILVTVCLGLRDTQHLFWISPKAGFVRPKALNPLTLHRMFGKLACVIDLKVIQVVRSQ